MSLSGGAPALVFGLLLTTITPFEKANIKQNLTTGVGALVMVKKKAKTHV